MARILILRERSAAEETAAMLLSIGHDPLILPLEEYRTLDLSVDGGSGETARSGTSGPANNAQKSSQTTSPEVQPSAASQMPEVPGSPIGPSGGDASALFSGFLLTSPRAVPALTAFVAQKSRPVFAVGKRTAAAARQAGFTRVLTAGGDAAALARVVAKAQFVPGARLLYAAGRTRTGTLETALADLGVELIVREAYATQRLDPERRDVEAVFSKGPSDAVLILSVGQAEAFCSLADRMPHRFVPKPVIAVLSSRIASALTPPWCYGALISRNPTMVSLFERLG